MIEQKDRDFMEEAFQRLKERGWISKLEPSTITEQEIAAFEKKYQITLPSLYKAFLTSYRLPKDRMNCLCAIIHEPDEDGDELEPLWVSIDSPRDMEDLEENMEYLQEIRDYCELPEDSFRYLIPIGDWGAGWGPLCIDLSRPESEIDIENRFTWNLVWFDHEEFEWDEYYLGEDGLLHGGEELPDLKTLLEWYFCGALEAKYEEEKGVYPTYEWYQSKKHR